jgi:hypothetical protein
MTYYVRWYGSHCAPVHENMAHHQGGIYDKFGMSFPGCKILLCGTHVS